MTPASPTIEKGLSRLAALEGRPSPRPSRRRTTRRRSATAPTTTGPTCPARRTSGIPVGSPPLTVEEGTDGIFVMDTPPGAKYDLIDFRCEVQPRALGIEITRCYIRGNLMRSITPGSLVNIGNNAPTAQGVVLTISDSEIAPDQPSVWWNGIGNHDYVAHRVPGAGTASTASASGQRRQRRDVEPTAPYGNDHAMFSPDPNHDKDEPVAKTHNDVIQWQGGSGPEVSSAPNLLGYYNPEIGEASYTADNPNPAGGGPEQRARRRGLQRIRPRRRTATAPCCRSPATTAAMAPGWIWHHSTVGGCQPGGDVLGGLRQSWARSATFGSSTTTWLTRR